MELLLRAATIRDCAISADDSATSNVVNSVADEGEPLRSSKLSRSDSRSSLPPKKRRKSHCRAAVGCPRSSASGAAVATAARSKGSFISDDFASLRSGSATEDAASETWKPNNRALGRCSKDRTAPKNGRRGASSKKKSHHSRGPKHPHSHELGSEMTDVEGNDVRMGYFSLPRHKTPPGVVPKADAPPQATIGAEALHERVPTSTEHEHEFLGHFVAGMSRPFTTLPEEQHPSPQATATQLLVCRAYLQMRYLALTGQ